MNDLDTPPPKKSIAHHKSYHPYRSDNIERVRRDEERAAAVEAGDRARVMQADAEARIAMLRSKKAKRGKTAEEDQAERALESQLKGKGRAEAQQQEDTGLQSHDAGTSPLNSITTKDGHINFWADLERGGVPGPTSQQSGPPRKGSHRKGNAEYEAEKQAEQDKWESQITMYLRAPPKTWYDSTDRLSHQERGRTEDQKLEHAYKDNQQKRGEDPLALMNAYLKRRDEVKAAQERAEADPWSDTPRTLASSRTPVVPPQLLQKRSRNGRDRDNRNGRRGGGRRSPSPLADVPAGPPRPAPPALSEAEKTTAREKAEGERAKALLAAKRASASVAATPQSEFGYQTGMYNREETRQARRYHEVRW